ncbi:MAG: thiopeptide-type bacteriocin biosynthesis protein [Deltaproteobacteria bacterium]|jgi:thiopeptide-type bacteriocin biosynthesis protein
MNLHWYQFNVGLVRQKGDARPSARHLFKSLLPYISEAACFFFVRKPPDVRLRFQIKQGALADSIEKKLEDLAKMGFIHNAASVVYEPEVHLFGGPAIMPFIHQHFYVDSQAWIELDLLSDRKPRSHCLLQVSRALMDDLFIQTLSPYDEEIWDVWRNLQRMLPLTEEKFEDSAAATIDALESCSCKSQAVWIRRYREANTSLAGKLALHAKFGKLESGVRSILAFIALFHYNRFGLSAKARCIADTMATVWDPRQYLIGAEPDDAKRWEKTNSSRKDQPR